MKDFLLYFWGAGTEPEFSIFTFAHFAPILVMLAVIFLEQLLKEKRHITAVIGVAASLCSLWIFGADSFLLPTMLVILVMLTVLRRPIEKAGDAV